MEVIAQSDWNWTLLADGDTRYFSVLCGGVAVYAVDFQLTADEASQLASNAPRAADDLANAARHDERAFSERHIPDFSTREDVRLAGLRWRNVRRAEA
jgi:hypothetical protein